MKYYSYLFNNYDLSKRKRLSKEYLYEGQIVAYYQREMIWGHNVGNCIEKTGLLEIEAKDNLPGGMVIYQATEYEILCVRAHSLGEEYLYYKYKNGENLPAFLVSWIENNKKPNCKKKEVLYALPLVMNGEDTSAFKQNVWNACKDKIGAIGLNYNKEKTELYTILIAQAMIVGCKKSLDDCIKLSTLLNKHWVLFSIIYSLFYGRNITTDHVRFIELLSYVLGKTGCEQYMHLMLIALGDPQQKIEKILRYSPADNSQKLWEKIMMIQRQKNLMEQSTDLDELFEILFPSTFREHLLNDNPYASIEEMLEDIKESHAVKDMLKKVEEYANNLKEELGKAITIESLRDAILKCDPASSRAIFAQLDMVLEGNNEVWDKYRKELKVAVNTRYEHQQKLLSSAHTVLIESNNAPINIENQHNYEGIAPREVQNQLKNTETTCHLLESTTERLTSISR